MARRSRSSGITSFVHTRGGLAIIATMALLIGFLMIKGPSSSFMFCQREPWTVGPLLELPEQIKKVAVNVGTNIDPLLPDASNPSYAVIGVDASPKTVMTVNERKIKNLFMISAAVANYTGVASFHIYQESEVSSSLSKVNIELGDFGIYLVPVITMAQLLDSIPPHIELTYLKTDMQGWDLTALKNAGKRLRRFEWLQCETYPDSVNVKYDGIGRENGMMQYLKFMEELGFKLNRTTIDGDEMDTFWSRID